MYLFHTRWAFRCVFHMLCSYSKSPYLHGSTDTRVLFLFDVNGIGTLAFVVISNSSGVQCLYCVS